MTFLTSKELVKRLIFHNEINELQLVGNEKEFGHILVNKHTKLPIFISDEKAILDVLEDSMINFDKIKHELEI